MGALSYGLTAFAYLIFSALAFTSWRGRLHGGLLVGAVAMTAVWAAFLAYQANSNYQQLDLIPLLEIMRNLAWLLFLIKLIELAVHGEGPSRFTRYHLAVMILSTVAIASYMLLPTFTSIEGAAPQLIAHLLMVVFGLVLVEQMFRNSRPEQRWAIKYLCFGLGGMFAYDFFLYSHALMFGSLDTALWEARGFVQLVVLPLLAVSVMRNPQWSLQVSVSRGVVFHTATLVAAGGYLIVMAFVGWGIRYYGGSWGVIGQAIFLFGALVMLIVLLFSGQMRARLRVFLSKHFFNYRYDYRREWLHLINVLSTEELGPRFKERVVQVLAELVDSGGGCLWLKKGDVFQVAGRFNLAETQPMCDIALGAALPQFMVKKQWIVDLHELAAEPDIYDNLEVPPCFETMKNGWLLVPLLHHGALYGFILLLNPLAPRSINWEDRDLLKTVGSQAASYLALADASEALMDARQFEAFNRLSAYVVHDLKNVVGQLSLVAENSKRFRDNQEFVDDAFSTVENAVAKMQRMLAQLRQGRPAAAEARALELERLIKQAVGSQSKNVPKPVLEGEIPNLRVLGDRDRLQSVIEHVINNAQDATPKNGWVKVACGFDPAGYAVVDISDNGCGMDAEFISQRLFKPFDTTKGNAGMGIGAYECREVIQALGGRVEVESTPGLGTRFRLMIPLLAEV